MKNFKFLFLFFLPFILFILCPSDVFSDEIVNFICPPSPFEAAKSDDSPQFEFQRIGELDIKRQINSNSGDPESYVREVTNEVTFPKASSREETAKLFFEKNRDGLGITTLFKDLKVIRSTISTLRYKPYYNGLPVAHSYFEFTMRGKNTVKSFRMNEIPIERFATEKLPTDPSATIAAASEMGSKKFGPEVKASHTELVLAVRDGVAYPAWCFSLQFKGGPYVIVAFDHDHSIYSSKCTLNVNTSLKNLFKQRIL